MPDALDGDFARSRAVLVGTWNYHHLNDVRAAKHSLYRMRNLLRSELCGNWPDGRITFIANPKMAGNLPHELVTSFKGVTDVALFYYVGHGQYDNDDRLCLALTDSSRDPVFRATTSLTFDAVRQAFRTSRAATKIAILDCCFAGIAGRTDTLAADGAGAALDSRGTSAGPQIPEPPQAPGFYLMMASGEFSTAWCETTADTSRPQTYFTKYLADVIENGIPGQPNRLTLGSIFDETADKLVSDGKPEPGNRAGNRAIHHILAQNAAAKGREGGDVKSRAVHQIAHVPEPRTRQPTRWSSFRRKRAWLVAGAVLMTAVLVVATVFILADPSDNDNELQLLEPGTLTVGVSTDDDYFDSPLISEPDDNVWVGFDPDLARALSDELNMQVKIVDGEEVPGDDFEELGKRYDVLMPARDYISFGADTPQNAFFIHYLDAGYTIYTMRNQGLDISSWADLCGKTVVANGSDSERLIENASSNECGRNPIELKSSSEPFKVPNVLYTGEVDAIIADLPIAVQAINDFGDDFELAASDLTEGLPIGVAVDKTNTALTDALQRALNELIENGDYGYLLSKWGLDYGAVIFAEVARGS